MKKNLAIFDFDNTIKQHSPKFKTAGGLAKFFPNEEIPLEIWKIMPKSFDDFCMAVVEEVNRTKVPKKDIIEAVENDGYFIFCRDAISVGWQLI